MTADQARGLVSDDHPYCLGFFDTALNWAAKLVGRADAVLLLGKKLDNTIRYGGIFDDAARIVQVDPSPTEIGRNRPVDVGMSGDVSAIVEQMTAAAQGKTWTERAVVDWRSFGSGRRRRRNGSTELRRPKRRCTPPTYTKYCRTS